MQHFKCVLQKSYVHVQNSLAVCQKNKKNVFKSDLNENKLIMLILIYFYLITAFHYHPFNLRHLANIFVF